MKATVNKVPLIFGFFSYHGIYFLKGDGKILFLLLINKQMYLDIFNVYQGNYIFHTLRIILDSSALFILDIKMLMKTIDLNAL